MTTLGSSASRIRDPARGRDGRGDCLSTLAHWRLDAGCSRRRGGRGLSDPAHDRPVAEPLLAKKRQSCRSRAGSRAVRRRRRCPHCARLNLALPWKLRFETPDGSRYISRCFFTTPKGRTSSECLMCYWSIPGCRQKASDFSGRSGWLGGGGVILQVIAYERLARGRSRSFMERIRSSHRRMDENQNDIIKVVLPRVGRVGHHGSCFLFPPFGPGSDVAEPEC